MSGTATIDAPHGLDTLSAEELSQIEQMRDDGPEDIAEPAAPPSAPPAPTAEDLEVEVPEAPAAPARQSAMVPHQAMHAERTQRKAAEKEAQAARKEAADAAAELAKERAVTQARLEMLAKLAETPAQPAAPVAAPVEEPLPDENTDPIGYFKALTARLENRLETQGGLLKGFTEQQRRMQEIQALREWGTAQELSFEAQEPAYREAMAWMRKSRHDELEALQILDPAERERIINGDVTMIAQRARQQGGNFAQILYNTAVKRGYTKKAEAPAAAAAAAPAPVIPPLDAAPRAARSEEGRENATTIGSLGSAPPAKLSVERIANMSESEFDALLTRAKSNPAAYPDFLRQLLGH